MILSITGIGWITHSGIGYGQASQPFALLKGPLPEITRKMVLDKPYRNFGRMDDYSKVGLGTIGLALKDSNLLSFNRKRDIGVIASTTYGCLNTDINYYQTVIPQQGTLASPNLFAYTLPNTYLGDASICFGLTGQNYVVSEPTPKRLISIQLGLQALLNKETDKMLCGFCDTPPLDIFNSADSNVYGSVFFMIERDCSPEKQNYGEIAQNKNGSLTLNQKPVEDIIGLVNRCLGN
jgi:3-oxoacyl-[acyl-carrier-protein] synthase II